MNSMLRCRSTCPDLGQRCSGPQHLGRQRVPEPVRSPPLQASPLAGPSHDGPDRLRCQRPVGPPDRHEHRPRLALRPPVLQPGGEFTSYDSTIPANITVGSWTAFAYLHNTTIVNVRGLKTGIYQNFAWLFVRVLTNSSAQVQGATVTLLNPPGGSIAYTGQTNSSGWAKVPHITSRGKCNNVRKQDCVCGPGFAGPHFNQQYVSPNNTSYFNMILNSGSERSGLNLFSYALRTVLRCPRHT